MALFSMDYNTITLNKNSTLYAVAPLPLDLHYNERHIQSISQSTNFSDMLLLSNSDMCKEFFKCNEEKISVFHTKETIKKYFITPPFTSILVGPAYACRKVLLSFFSWAYLEKDIFSMSYKSLKKHKAPSIRNRKTTKKEVQAPIVDTWMPYDMPKTWARATFSTVELPCYNPAGLQKELERFFNAPIIVKSYPICSIHHHNESLAWLYAIYSISAARIVGRTTLCHYQSINPQYMLWYKNHDELSKPNISSSWLTIIKSSMMSKQTIEKYAKIKTSTKQKTECETVTLEKSNYAVKSYLYRSTQKTRRIIGYSSVQLPIICDLLEIKKAKKQLPNLTLKRINKNIFIYTPYVPSIHTIQALKKIVHNILPNTNIVTVSPAQESFPLPEIHNSFSIIANLLLQALRKINPKSKTVTATLPTTLHKTYSQTSCVIEYGVSTYSASLLLENIYLTIDVGYVIQKGFLINHIEYIIKKTLSYIIGKNQIMQSKKFKTAINFINETNTAHTASVQDILSKAIYTATHNALLYYYKNKKDIKFSIPLHSMQVIEKL